MANFDLEKLAVEYCAEHGIDLFDPARGQVLTAFCIGAKIEREACAKTAEDFNTFPHAISAVGERIATEIRMRSNAKVSRSAPLLAQVGSTDGLGDNDGEAK